MVRFYISIKPYHVLPHLILMASLSKLFPSSASAASPQPLALCIATTNSFLIQILLTTSNPFHGKKIIKGSAISLKYSQKRGTKSNNFFKISQSNLWTRWKKKVEGQLRQPIIEITQQLMSLHRRWMRIQKFDGMSSYVQFNHSFLINFKQ